MQRFRIHLGGSSYYTSDTVVARNFIFGTGVAGISVTGLAFPELEVAGNTITPQKGDGIVVGTGGARIADNRIANIGGEAQNGIRLARGPLAVALSPIVVSGNRLQGLRGNGLVIGGETLLVSAVVEHNVFNAIEGNGVIMQPGSAAASLKVLGNELINIGVTSTTSARRGRLRRSICAAFLKALCRITQLSTSAATRRSRSSSPASAWTTASTSE